LGAADPGVREFDPDLPLHREITSAAAEAEVIAAAVLLPEGDYRRKRRAIRDALANIGLAGRMNELVTELLGS
jgi:hypothetical protein